MPKYVTPGEAVSIIKSGDMIGINAFLMLVNPAQLLYALGERFAQTGEPGNLSFFCSAGFGTWSENSPCEEPIRLGAAKKLILGHFSSMPETCRRILSNQVEAYNLPLGCMSHMVRAAAAGIPFYITKTGLNLFVDPIYGGSKMNNISQEDWVSEIIIDGERFLKYKTPRFDVVMIKATSSDKYGNISFEKEPITMDALSMAQAAKANGGKVIVQVERLTDDTHRPWNVIIPSALVDYICVCPSQTQIFGSEEYTPSYSGDEHIAPEQIPNWLSAQAKKTDVDPARETIVVRAAKELRPQQIVNIGIGIPEGISEQAVKSGLSPKLTITVESGATGGMPSSLSAFGASAGAQSICNCAQMFDLYDGGGLDIAFIGALEIDKYGNVNGHCSPSKLAGIGGFANITQNTPKVVFCGTFSAGGLKIDNKDGVVTILREGKYSKFVDHVSSVSFSAENAHSNNQEVLYVTERCVFRLGTEGLELIEVYPGVDLERDILSKLPFEPKLCLNQS